MSIFTVRRVFPGRKAFIFFTERVYLYVIITLIFSFLPAYGEVITVVYTGNSFASLYPCGRCPATVGGGITRRATVIKNIRKEKKNVLVVDAGNLFAGGALDTNSINPDLDKKRTQYYLDALEKMGYDILTLGREDFNLGLDFLKNSIEKHKLRWVSSNISLPGLEPYIIKKFKKVKIAILALTNTDDSDFLDKEGIKTYNYKEVLQKWVDYLQNKVDYILLLSNLDDIINKKIAQAFPQIKTIISSGYPTSTSPYEIENNTLLLRTSYQAKELRMLHLEIDKGKLLGWGMERKKLSLNIPEAEEIKKIIPACFTDNDCHPSDRDTGRCVNPATLRAPCEKKEVSCLLITYPELKFCLSQPTQKFLKQFVGNIKFKIIDYQEKQAQILLKKYNIETLPSFILPSPIEKEKKFLSLTKFLDKRGDSYLLKKELAGICFFLNREARPKKVDVFFSLYDPNLYNILKTLHRLCQEEGLNLNLHFLFFKKEGRYTPMKGKEELEEIQRLLVIKKLYPHKFWEYLISRIKDIQSTWWSSILENLGMDYRKIEDSVKNTDFTSFYERDYALAEKLGINRGVTMLVGNKIIFRILQGDKEELKKLLSYINSKPEQKH